MTMWNLKRSHDCSIQPTCYSPPPAMVLLSSASMSSDSCHYPFSIWCHLWCTWGIHPPKKTGPCVCRPWSRSHDLVNKKTSWMNTIRRTQKTSHEWDERKSLERFLKKWAKLLYVARQTYHFLAKWFWLLFDLTTLLSQIGGAHLYWSNRPSASSASTCPARR